MDFTHQYIFDKFDKTIFREFENNELAAEIQFEINDNQLKIIEFHSGGTDPLYRNGTELLLHLLITLNIRPNVIHGMLSTVDAPSKIIPQLNNGNKQVGWIKSIPFYAALPKYINQTLNTTYKFRLYQGSYYFRTDITEKFMSAVKANLLESYIDKLINANQNCSFELHL